MKTKRNIIEIDENLCDGCGVCVLSCAEGAIQVIDGKAKLIADKYCDGLGACLEECPRGALKIIEREADVFTFEAVKEHANAENQCLYSEKKETSSGCPSNLISIFNTASSCKKPNADVVQSTGVPALSHWPVQIKLVPATAPFLKGSDILIAADCTAFAYPNFHDDFLRGKALLVGCPKLDDTPTYVQKFAEIFAEADIRSITVVVMEVPCCQGLPVIIQKGMALAGKSIPMGKIVITSRGNVFRRESL